MLKSFYNKFWYPVLGKILSNFIFLFEGKNNNKKKNSLSEKNNNKYI